MTHVAGRSASARRGPLAKAGETAVWFYAALLLALSGTTEAAPEPTSLRIESDRASALHDGSQGLSRPATNRTAALRQIGLGQSFACTHTSAAADFAHSVRPADELDCGHTPELTRLSLGFLADRALAPPRLA